LLAIVVQPGATELAIDGSASQHACSCAHATPVGVAGLLDGAFCAGIGTWMCRLIDADLLYVSHMSVVRKSHGAAIMLT